MRSRGGKVDDKSVESYNTNKGVMINTVLLIIINFRCVIGDCSAFFPIFAQIIGYY